LEADDLTADLQIAAALTSIDLRDHIPVVIMLLALARDSSRDLQGSLETYLKPKHRREHKGNSRIHHITKAFERRPQWQHEKTIKTNHTCA